MFKSSCNKLQWNSLLFIAKTLVLIGVVTCNVQAQFENAELATLVNDLKSDRYSVSQKASEELMSLLTSVTIETWFSDEFMSADFARQMAGSPVDDLDELLGHCNEQVVYCALEVIARLGPGAVKKDVMLESMMNDLNVSAKIRQQAFRALCSISQKQKSVLDRVHDIGLLFDLYNCEAVIRMAAHSSPDSTVFNYFGLIAVAENVGMSTLRGTGHTESEVRVLARSLDAKHPKIVRIFCMLLLGSIGSDSNSSLPDLDAQLKDTDLDIRFFASFAILNITPSNLVKETTIRKANLGEQNTLFLTKSFEQTKNKQEKPDKSASER